jgi:phosphate/sulfate permease
MIMAWIEFYLVGAAVGVLVAVLLVIRAVEEYNSGADWVRKEARAKMVWSIVGAVLFLPVTGVIFAGLLYLVLR